MIEIDFIYEVPYFVGLQLFESQNAIEKKGENCCSRTDDSDAFIKNNTKRIF